MFIFNEIGDDARRQYIDARGTFIEYERTLLDARSVQGSMFWRKQGAQEYLVRQSAKNTQTSLGPRSPETENTFERFSARKTAVTDRLTHLEVAIERHRRMNRALFVGRAPQILIDILNALVRWEIADHFMIVGTHALYAYEAAATVRVGNPATLATRDVDLLWDTRRRVQFVSRMNILGSSMLGLLQRVDPSFRLSEDERFKAINKNGFEVDIIRREASEGDGNPLPLTEPKGTDEFYAVQAERAGRLLSAPRFSAIVVSASGDMANLKTIHPASFVEFKRWMSSLNNRDAAKRSRDALQAETVEALMEQYLPHLLKDQDMQQ
jgi:hypothetical protein